MTYIRSLVVTIAASLVLISVGLTAQSKPTGSPSTAVVPALVPPAPVLTEVQQLRARIAAQSYEILGLQKQVSTLSEQVRAMQVQADMAAMPKTDGFEIEWALDATGKLTPSLKASPATAVPPAGPKKGGGR